MARLAVRPTGIVNLYNSYRSSALDWCNHNAERIIELLNDAYTLGTDDGLRIDLAIRMEALGRISTPNGAKSLKASGLLTPLFACLDRHLRFPIVNRPVLRYLSKHESLRGKAVSLEVYAEKLISMMDQHRIDALKLDATIDAALDLDRPIEELLSK